MPRRPRPIHGEVVCGDDDPELGLECWIGATAILLRASERRKARIEEECMKATEQQIWLGWEHVDRANSLFRCKWHTKKKDKNQPPHIASVHRSLTSALHTNGNTARNWQAEGGEAEESLATGTWILSQGGRPCVVLTVDHIGVEEVRTAPIAEESVKAETGEVGRLGALHDLLRSRGIECRS